MSLGINLSKEKLVRSDGNLTYLFTVILYNNNYTYKIELDVVIYRYYFFCICMLSLFGTVYPHVY